jgi:hypothetical protein
LTLPTKGCWRPEGAKIPFEEVVKVPLLRAVGDRREPKSLLRKW